MKKIILPSLSALFLLTQLSPVLSEEAVPTPAETEVASSVQKLVIASAVAEREPVDELTTAAASSEKVYCWTRIALDNVPTTVTHIWYADGKKVAEVPLTVKTNPCRTWSNKSIWPGKWKVEVADESGKILASKDFSVE